MTMLGSMLRIDVNRTDSGKNYAIPKDKSVSRQSCCLPETFAIGLRNPWRYSFDQAGRLVVADVGQDLYEEIDNRFPR
jgi:glucose/arabinose dehydrogenase